MSEHPISTSALFSNSPMELLESFSTQEFWQYAQSLAKISPEPVQPFAEALLCGLPEGQCILPIAFLREVITPPYQLSFLPSCPRWMLGVAAWRGEAVAVVDLSAYLSQQEPSYPTEGVLVIAQHEEQSLGLYITLTDSMSFDAQQVQPVTNMDIRPFTMPPSVLQGFYTGIPVLHLPVILDDMVQHIKMATSYE